jgi:hypothetical protein
VSDEHVDLTVACLLVKPYYSPEYVRRLKTMVEWHVDRPCRFVCLTDQPKAMPAGVRAIPVRAFRECFEFWTKLEIFNPKRGFTGRMLYLDLDVLIVSSLAPIIDYPASFAIAAGPHWHNPKAPTRDGQKRHIFGKFNASVIVWNGGEQTHLFAEWTHNATTRLQTDQDWYAERSPDAERMPLEWFPRISQVQPPWAPEAKVILCKKPKNHQAVEQWPWFDAMWGGAR